MPVGAILGPVIAGGLEALGVGATAAEAIAPIAGGVLGGAGIGAGLAELTGGKPLLGALTGGLTGGVTAGAGELGPALGLGAAGTTALETAAGAGAGALGAGITGQSPLLGAAEGGAAGLAQGITSAVSPATPATTVSPAPITGVSGGGESAAALAPANLNVPTGGGAAGGDIASAAAAGGGASGVGLGATGTQLVAGGAAVPSSVSTTGASVTPLDTAATGVSGVSVDPFGNLTIPATTAAGGGGIGGALGSIFGSPYTLPLLAGGGLALDYLLTKPVSQMPEAQPLEQAAAQLGAEGTQLTSYLTSGGLPPGAQAAVDQATQAAKAQIRANYAQLGLGGSTEETSALNQADQNAAAMTFQITDQLLAQGANFSQLSSQLYSQILNLTVQQDTAFQQALATFSSGLAGAGLTAGLRAAA